MCGAESTRVVEVQETPASLEAVADRVIVIHGILCVAVAQKEGKCVRFTVAHSCSETLQRMAQKSYNWRG